MTGTATAVLRAPAQQTLPERGFRPDIQGLRAVAVALVVLYHLWPNRLTGGFVGVDVFLVVSGFLITSHLWSRPPRTGRDLAEFWGRRVRRLLPASLLVLAVTTVATRLVVPETQWASTAREIVAAASYVENWRLASTSVDYLAAENAPSPVQHFWSLSVEEQFYLLWPVLVLLLVAVAARQRWHRRLVVSLGLGAVVVASLAFSVHATATEPASAYFITPTRIWELGLGGLLAVATAGNSRGLAVLPHRLRAVLAWLGFAAVATAALTYTGATAFPGWHALLPVLGTVAVIGAADPAGRWSPGRLLDRRPVQLLGDLSYSVYLWHWPLIVLLPHVLGGALRGTAQAFVIVASLLLAWATKILVEDRFRRPPPGAPLRRTFQAAALAMGVVVALGVVLGAEAAHREAVGRQELANALSGNDPCFGAAAMARGPKRCPADRAGVVPAPAQAVLDKSDAYAHDCFEPAPFDGLRRCMLGDPAGTVSVAVVGNSHMGHWLPAVEEVAKQRHWRLTTFLASECTVSATPVVWDSQVKQRGCTRWAERVLRETSDGGYDLVVTSERNGRAAVGHAYDDSYTSWRDGYRRSLTSWVRADLPVLVIHDTATPGATMRSVPDCVAEHEDDVAACSGPRDRWVPEDPLVEAARQTRDRDIKTVDLNDLLCDETTCPAVIGGVLVYFDASHLTATYARTLAPYLEPALAEAARRIR